MPKPSGKPMVTSYPLEDPEDLPVRITLSDKRTDKNDILLYHKTTKRTLYDTELSKCRAKGYFDCIFMNQEDKITEGAVSNIIIKENNTFFTPPIACGLLPGIYREYMLKVKDIIFEEKVLDLEDIRRAESIFLINSVRKILPAVLD